MNRYKAIVKYKTGYYSFFLPVALAMNMAGIKDPELYRQSKIILLEMGHFFQVGLVTDTVTPSGGGFLKMISAGILTYAGMKTGTGFSCRHMSESQLK